MHAFWEAVDVLLSSLCLCIVVIFSRYIATEIYLRGRGRMRLRAAIGIAVMAGGFAVMLGAAAFGRHHEEAGESVRWMMQPPWVVIPGTGAFVAAIGLLCLIRVFSPDEWGRWGWVVCAGIALAATTISILT